MRPSIKKEGEKEWTKLSAKADLLSSALPPVMAEALQPNEETVTSGRQLIARPAGTYGAFAGRGGPSGRRPETCPERA